MWGNVCLNLNLKRVQQRLINAGAGNGWLFFFPFLNELISRNLSQLSLLT